MWGRTAVLVAVCCLLVVGGSGGAMAQTGEHGGLGEAQVLVTIDPVTSHVEGQGAVDVQVHVEGVLACAPGSPPAPLRVTLLPEDDSLQVVMDPGHWIVEWERMDGDREIRYQVNESRQVETTVVSPPVERVVTQFVPLLQIEGGAGLNCTQDGYSIHQQDEQRDPLVVEPAPAQSANSDARSTGPFNWVPLLMALVLMGAVALFAYERERRRE